ncbi:Aquaporin-1 [Cyphellophora attinorum]|uniref:Aquaporin-1 n=1 Tax=Cyphellophora attinorum TaxID=1664694 RepID=A0A0N1HCQ3_9EURO|nr:Aquaporin-1 [Phialophora attinorum]KPI41690.1 Aquaporin-1 [Phialophora attinorum]
MAERRSMHAAATGRAGAAELPRRGSSRVLGRTVGFVNWLRDEGNTTTPFAGRLGGSGAFVLDPSDPDNSSLLDRVPDASPNMTFQQAFDMRGFAEPILWKAGVIEFWGTLLSTFASVWFAMSPNLPPPPPDPVGGIIDTATFKAALAGSVQAAFLIALLVYGFGSVSGAHFNPLITFGAFFARLTTFPRMVIYVGMQTAGAALAGLLIRAGRDSRNFKVGGCFMFEGPATVGGALTVEIMACLLALFLAFGVGFDPRQRNVYGPALAPALVGGVVGVCALTFSFALEGYGGASLNPARCFGAYVGSRFPGWHWVHWVGPITASAFHGLIYFLVPPETFAEGRAVQEPYMPHGNEKPGVV